MTSNWFAHGSSPQVRSWLESFCGENEPAEAELAVVIGFENLLLALRAAKPGGRDEMDRKYAITITEVEKAMAAYMYWLSSHGV